MGKKKANKLTKEVFSGCASANECTGLYQKVSLDPDEVAKFHEEFTDDDN